MTYIDHRGASGSGSALRGLIGAAVLICVVVGGWWGAAPLIDRATEPGLAPKCYWPDEAYVPRNEAIPLVGTPDRNGVPNNRRRVGPYDTDKVLAAERACRPDACSSQALKEYKSALFWYLEPRLQHIRQLDMAYGDNGLRLARSIYSKSIDRQIENGVRERYRAKVFRINNSRQNRDAMAILIFQGGAALRSCRSADLRG